MHYVRGCGCEERSPSFILFLRRSRQHIDMKQFIIIFFSPGSSFPPPPHHQRSSFRVYIHMNDAGTRVESGASAETTSHQMNGEFKAGIEKMFYILM